MREEQKTLARALGEVDIPIHTKTHAFANDMAYRATLARPKPLTGPQAEWLRTAVLSYRRHIAPDVVALAEHMGTQTYAEELHERERVKYEAELAAAAQGDAST